MFVYLVVVILAILTCMYQWKIRKFSKTSAQVKQPVRSYPILGVSYLLFGNCEDHCQAVQFGGRVANENGGLIGFWLGHRLFLMVSDPEIAEFFFKTCLEKDDLYKLYVKALGNATIAAPVPIWRPRRKKMMHIFSQRNLHEFIFPIFVKNTAVLVELLKARVGKGPFAMWDYLCTSNMDSVCESVFGVQFNSQSNPDQPFLKACTEAHGLLSERILKPWLHSDLIYKCMPQGKRLIKAVDEVQEFVKKIIDTKRKEVNSKPGEQVWPSFLEQLIQAGEYSDVELLEEMTLLVNAATDTSALVSGFTLHMLARHQEIQEKVYEELLGIFGDSERPPQLEDLQSLRYLEAVIKESARLYPPGPVILRKVTKDVVLPSGVTVVEGCGVVVNIWGLHRNREYWGDDAEQFRPERFLDTPLKHPAQFMPFSYGPRNCPGYQYGLLSLKTTLAAILRRYRVLPAEDHQHKPIRCTLKLMMKDVDGFVIRLESRSS